MQQGGDVAHQNAPCILSDMSTGCRTAVTEKGSHTMGYGRTNTFSFLAVTFIWSSVGETAPLASALPVGPTALIRLSCEVVNVGGSWCWRDLGRARAPQAATAVVMGPGGAHLQ